MGQAPENRNVDYPIPDSFLELAGLYISEGSSAFRDHEQNEFKGIRFSQKYEKNDFFKIADKLMSIYPIKKYTYSKETIWTLSGLVAEQIFDNFGHHKTKDFRGNYGLNQRRQNSNFKIC